jgi:hypothetical protein
MTGTNGEEKSTKKNDWDETGEPTAGQQGCTRSWVSDAQLELINFLIKRHYLSKRGQQKCARS